MGIGRSTYYDAAPAPTDDTAIVEAIAAICEEFECYGWRRVRAALRQQGMIVNHKKIKRLMCEHGLQPRIRRRYVATTDSDHDQPIFPNRTKDVIVDRPDRLWVADITYVAIAVGFAYVAVILDAWSRRVVGYAISRSIDARLTMAALKSAVERRKPPPGCMHHSDRGSQGGFKWSSQHLDGSCDEHSKTALGLFWAGALVLTRSTAGGRARGAAAILGSDCGGHGE
jgi:putative transposase